MPPLPGHACAYVPLLLVLLPPLDSPSPYRALPSAFKITNYRLVITQLHPFPSTSQIKRNNHSLDKIMPQYTSRVLQHPYEHGDLRTIVLDRRTDLVLRGSELTELAEACEPPVTLLVDEAVVGVCIVDG
jgi:hypothetical protein